MNLSGLQDRGGEWAWGVGAGVTTCKMTKTHNRHKIQSLRADTTEFRPSVRKTNSQQDCTFVRIDRAR